MALLDSLLKRLLHVCNRSYQAAKLGGVRGIGVLIQRLRGRWFQHRTVHVQMIGALMFSLCSSQVQLLITLQATLF